MIDTATALLRAAAKNFVDVVPVRARLSLRGDPGRALRRRPPRHPPQARRRGIRPHRRLRDVDRGVVRGRRDLPPRLLLSLERDRSLRLWREPHQRAAQYAEVAVRVAPPPSRVDRLGGKELSFNNLNDLDAARGAPRVHAANVRHRQAREPVRGGRRRDDRGGTRRRSRPIPSLPTAARGAGTEGPAGNSRRASPISSIEVLIAPIRDEEALGAVRAWRPCGSSATASDVGRLPAIMHYRRVLRLVQDADAEVDDRSGRRSSQEKIQRAERRPPSPRASRSTSPPTRS